MKKTVILLIALALAPVSALAQGLSLPDCVYVADFGESKGMLTIRNGFPESYKTTSGYSTKKVRLMHRNSTIRIEAAQIKNITVDGDAFVGDWKYWQGWRKDLRFECKQRL